MKMKIRKAEGIEKYIGLMFKSKKTSAIIMEFEEDVNIAIHSWFVFFSFKAIWLDKNNKIIEKRIIRPFTSSAKPHRDFRKLIEIPLA